MTGVSKIGRFGMAGFRPYSEIIGNFQKIYIFKGSYPSLKLQDMIEISSNFGIRLNLANFIASLWKAGSEIKNDTFYTSLKIELEIRGKWNCIVW